MGTQGLDRLLFSAVLITALCAGSAATAAAQTPAPRVTVLVDGNPVAFDHPPAIGNGRILVPLRGVFERLGARVSWDPSSQTVRAQRGAASVELRIGAAQAFVNGQAQKLDAPATLLGGRTFVPLRFVSQALGAVAAWDASTSTVRITSPGAAAAATPSSSAAPSSAAPAPGMPSSVTYGPIQTSPVMPVYQVPQTISGTVTQVNASGYPGQLTVQSSNGGVFIYQIVSATAVTRTDTATGAGGPVALSAVAAGDAVTITSDPAGTAQTVRDLYSLVNGTVGSVGLSRVVLRNGQAYPVSPIVRVTRGGLAATAESLQPGDVVALHINPTSGLVYGIDAGPSRAVIPAAAINRVTVSPAGRAFVPGDVMTVTAAGPPNGAATFSINGAWTGLPMRESLSQPGTYVGTYAIQPGDEVIGATVIVTITTSNNQVLTAAAPAAVSITGTATLPPNSGPVIVTPTSGNPVQSPFTVTGTAPPRARVKIQADYSGSVLLLPVHGILGTQTVLADSNGNWSATFTGQPSAGSVRVTITAVLVDQSGAARTPATTVTTTLQ